MTPKKLRIVVLMKGFRVLRENSNTALFYTVYRRSKNLYINLNVVTTTPFHGLAILNFVDLKVFHSFSVCQ